MGTFDVVDIIFKRSVKCPSCVNPTNDPENLGFYDCTYTIMGKMLEPKRMEVKETSVASSEHFTTFKKSKAQWATLEIKTAEIETASN